MGIGSGLDDLLIPFPSLWAYRRAQPALRLHLHSRIANLSFTQYR